MNAKAPTDRCCQGSRSAPDPCGPANLLKAEARIEQVALTATDLCGHRRSVGDHMGTTRPASKHTIRRSLHITPCRLSASDVRMSVPPRPGVKVVISVLWLDDLERYRADRRTDRRAGRAGDSGQERRSVLRKISTHSGEPASWSAELRHRVPTVYAPPAGGKPVACLHSLRNALVLTIEMT